MIRHELRHGEILQARAEAVYASLEPGSYTMAELDGPYNMGVAEWDKVPDLAAFYEPHLAAVSSLLSPSSSLYFWNTHSGLIDVDPVIRSFGWTRASVITWNKGNTQAMKGIESARYWPNVTEVCGFYMRDSIKAPSVAYAAGADERNWIRTWLAEEWTAAGLKNRDADTACGTNGMAGHYFGSSQWGLPTIEAYLRLGKYAAECGRPRERPYLVHPSVWDGAAALDERLRDSHLHLQTSHEHLRREHEHLRVEYEALRAPFTLTAGVSNVWTHPQLQDAERLLNDKGETLHVAQKPTMFSRRMIEASTRPGDKVLSVFSGTCRVAVACEQIARYHPEEARRFTCIEQDEDGRGYIAAVLKSIHGELGNASGKRGQIGLFGAANG